MILAAGDFPRPGGEARRLLTDAAHVVACDGAARTYRRVLGKWPTAIVGDFDSFRGHPGGECELVIDRDENHSDLEKAIAYCRRRGWRNPVIVGAGGGREDHTLGNLFRALDAGVEVVTDYGCFYPVATHRTFRAAPNTGVSVFAPDRTTRMTSRGLRWPLDGVEFSTLYAATLNRTCATRFSVTTTRPVLVFVAESAVRSVSNNP